MLNSLRADSGQAILARPTRAGSLSSLAGADLLAAACRPGSAGLYDDSWVRAAADCFLDHYGLLFVSDGATGPLAATSEIASVDGGIEPGERFVQLHQRFAGYQVRGAVLNLFFINGTLVHVTGGLKDPGRWVDHSPDTDGALRAASQSTGRLLEFVGEVMFDADLQDLVLNARDSEDPALRLVISARNGDVLETHRDEQHAGPGLVNRLANVYPYPYGTNFLGSPTINSPPVNPIVTSEPVLRYCLAPDAQGNCADNAQCVFEPQLPGYPTAYVGQGLTHKINDVPTYVATTVFGGQPLGVAAVSTCTGTEPLNNAGAFVWPSLSYLALSGYRSLRRIAYMKNHFSSYLDQGTYHQPLPLQLNVQSFDISNGAAIYTAFDSRISVEWFQNGGQHFTSASALTTLAHEYGHHAHHGYGCALVDQQTANYNCGRTSQTTGAVKEGWAESFALRWLLYGVVGSGEYLGGSYYWNNPYPWIGMQYQHNDLVQNGEYVAGSVQGSFADQDFFYSVNPNCTDENDAILQYNCGTAIPITFWELAWNVCRSSFLNCTAGTDLIVGGPFAPYALANSAFGYAIAMSTGDVGDFLYNANVRYEQFSSIYGYLDSTEYSRVTSVFEHHCSGVFGHYCEPGNGYHHPGSPYASAYSVKATGYSEAEFWARSGGATQVNAGNTASGGLYVNLPQNGMVSRVVGLTGPRLLHLAVRRASGTGSVVLAVTDASGSRNWSLSMTPTFQWLPSSSTFSVTLNAGTTLSIRNTSPAAVRLDAVWVE